jgi:hypothetical protein
MFLNARLNSGKYSSCKILHSFKSFVDFLNVVAGRCAAGGVTVQQA